MNNEHNFGGAFLLFVVEVVDDDLVGVFDRCGVDVLARVGVLRTGEGGVVFELTLLLEVSPLVESVRDLDLERSLFKTGDSYKLNKIYY